MRDQQEYPMPISADTEAEAAAVHYVSISWQVVPTMLPELLQDQNAEKSQRVMKAMLQIRKLDIAALKQAQIG
jgi:predicted 3-demethylubiquinone-9 3-methyltransferase (glyoxalase superfamily)